MAFQRTIARNSRLVEAAAGVTNFSAELSKVGSLQAAARKNLLGVDISSIAPKFVMPKALSDEMARTLSQAAGVTKFSAELSKIASFQAAAQKNLLGVDISSIAPRFSLARVITPEASLSLAHAAGVSRMFDRLNELGGENRVLGELVRSFDAHRLSSAQLSAKTLVLLSDRVGQLGRSLWSAIPVEERGLLLDAEEVELVLSSAVEGVDDGTGAMGLVFAACVAVILILNPALAAMLGSWLEALAEPASFVTEAVLRGNEALSAALPNTNALQWAVIIAQAVKLRRSRKA